MDNDFLANVKQEGDIDPFAELDNQVATPAEPPTEKPTDTVEPPTEGGAPAEEPATADTQDTKPLPYHLDPRWQEIRNENKELKDAIAEISNQQAEIIQRVSTPSSVRIPDWFSTLYGENEPAWQQYEGYQQSLKDDIKREVLREQYEAQQAQERESQQWTAWVDDELSKLQASGEQFDRNELIKTMLEYRPTDAENNYDFKAGLKILKATKPQEDKTAQNARKAIADIAPNTSGGTGKKDFVTSEEMRRSSWQSIMD